MNKRLISEVSDNGKFGKPDNSIRRQGNPLKRRRLAKPVSESKSEFLAFPSGFRNLGLNLSECDLARVESVKFDLTRHQRVSINLKKIKVIVQILEMTRDSKLLDELPF